MEYVLLTVGLCGLLLGGDLLVRGAVSLARRFGVSPMIIGLTLVGFGTSTPELVTSVQAAFAGAPGIAVGNVVGSNIANILLILGIAALACPMRVEPAALWRDGTALAVATLLGAAIVWSGEIGPGHGLALLAGLTGYLALTILHERRSATMAGAVYEETAGQLRVPEFSVATSAVMLVGGLGITLVSARALVTGAITVAEGLGMSEAVIGLTIVAVGTSMPELVTSAIAARKGQSDVALGNVIGSNLFNILGILGTTAALHPVAVPAEMAGRDIWVMLAATATLIVFARTGWRIGRREGALLLAGYAGYTGWLVASL